MKFPEHCLSMEAGMPSPVHKWLTQELEQLGIDSLVYTRYIISLLLHQGIEDFDWYDNDEVFCNKMKSEKLRKKGKKQDQKVTISEEEAKKTAVIDCLSAVSEEKSGIKSLVEELCTKLKEKDTESSNNQTSTSDSSEESCSENQNPAERYYAAFPSLNNQDSVSTPSHSPSVSVWKKNPLTKAKSLPTNITADCDICSPSVDAEVRKINISCRIPVPKHRRHKKYSNRSNEKKKNAQKPPNTKPSDNMKQTQEWTKKQDCMQNWPPGFAKTDPYVLQNIDMYGNKLVLRSDIRQPQDEICTQVEQILKGYLLPAPDKAYKELLDVDTENVFEQRERVIKSSIKEEQVKTCLVSTEQIGNQNKPVSNEPEQMEDASRERSISKQSYEDSLSPELQEQEIWYTQPIDVIFLGQEEEPQESKLRLYKRNSLSSLSPGLANSAVQNDDCLWSGLSSPTGEQRESQSSPDSDFILQDSDLITAWLTEELLADFDDETSHVKDEACSFKASSPNPTVGRSGSDIFEKLDLTLDQSETAEVHSPACVRSGSSTPTCKLLPVSLLDLDYLATVGQGYGESFLFDGLTTTACPRRYSFSSWQSRVLIDSLTVSYNIPEDKFFTDESPCWQPLEMGGSSLAQLWDVNMQKRVKFSTWERQNAHNENQIWSSENMLIFHNAGEELENFSGKLLSDNQNTLIPQISIDTYDYSDDDYQQDDADDNERIPLTFHSNFDRSVSLGDVYGWLDNSQKHTDPQLSKSFDLVPSEHSAFYDVPRRLVHVHSEPNLVQFRQDFLDEIQSQATSPPEHLFFSPKTHFRPITPAYAPELSSASKTRYVLNDLFGGLPTTKTPYQQFHFKEGESEEETFVPKFKLKNFSKSIQTGEGFEADSSDNEDDIGESEMRDTPETLTLGMIEDVMGEKDEDIDLLVPISEDFDTANTDSAYETDYGVSNSEYGQDGHHEGCHVCKRKVCHGQGTKDECQTGEGPVKQPDLGNVIDYTVQSFEATYPHTQDWPDMSQSLNCTVESGHYWNCNWQSHSYHGYPLKSTWSTDEFLSTDGTDDDVGIKEKDVCCKGQSLDLTDHWVTDQYAIQYNEQEVIPGQWVEDFGENLFFDDKSEAIYPITWSSFDKEDNASDETSPDFNLEVQVNECSDDQRQNASIVDNLFNVDMASSMSYDNKIQGDRIICDRQPAPCQRLKVFSSQFFDDVDNDKVKPDDFNNLEGDPAKNNELVVQEGEEGDNVFNHLPELEQNSGDLGQSYGDYYRVKLVYKDNIQEPWKLDSNKKKLSYGYGVGPLPDDAKLSTELEKEWLDPDLQITKTYFIPSSSQRKPCSFFLEGNCRRTDCKFAHDIANITCRFWEEGGCFKGPLCPFLHGYPSIMSSSDKLLNKFDLQSEEFPELSSARANSINNKKERVGVAATSGKERITRTPGRHTSGIGSKREKLRKQNNRRHSNKENRIELCIVDKCSSSI